VIDLTLTEILARQQSDEKLAQQLQVELNALPPGDKHVGDDELARKLQQQFDDEDEQRRAKVEANKEDLFDVLSDHRTSIQDFLDKKWDNKFGIINDYKENPWSRPGQPLYNNFVTEWQKVQDQKVALVFHGTSETNIDVICREGLDPKRRHGQAYGPGEYFAETNGISFAYCKGGKKMLVFAVLMDKTGLTTKAGEIVVINKTSHQLPLFVVSFQHSTQMRTLQAQSMALLSGAQRAFVTKRSVSGGGGGGGGGGFGFGSIPSFVTNMLGGSFGIPFPTGTSASASLPVLGRPTTHRPKGIKRTKQTARKSTGGKTPRKQLAAKAATSASASLPVLGRPTTHKPKGNKRRERKRKRQSSSDQQQHGYSHQTSSSSSSYNAPVDLSVQEEKGSQ